MDKIDSILNSDTIPHILFYGSEDRSPIDYLLDRIYKEKDRSDCMFIECATCKGIDVIRDEIKEFAKQQIRRQLCFKSIILYDAENLTIDAQYSLRRCIEIYSKTTRFFILTVNKDKLINPICSRFIHIYIPTIQYQCPPQKWTPTMKSWLKGDNLYDISEKLYIKGIYGDQLLEYYRPIYKDTIEWIEFEIDYEHLCGQLKNETWILYMILKFQKTSFPNLSK